MLEQRNTGANLFYPCMVKVWADARLCEHYKIMLRRPDVYCPVFGCSEDAGEWSLIMPLFKPHTEMEGLEVCRSALDKLKLLWGTYIGQSVSPVREEYQKFIETLDVPEALKDLCGILYNQTENIKGTIAFDIHGDASIQNIVHYDNIAYWIDPSPRPVPLEREIDLGKLMMSLLGYDNITAKMSQLTWQLLHSNPDDSRLTLYYCATHLARIWRDQIDRRDWIMQTTKELSEGIQS